MARNQISPDACAPTALSKLFAETFEQACDRIHAVGGDPRAVTRDVFDRLLAPHGIQQRIMFKRPAVFASWRRWKRGAWVTVVTGDGSSTGHCVTMRDGEPMGNHWVRFVPGRLRYESLRVHAAWRIAA
jgi:hypothetical protein